MMSDVQMPQNARRAVGVWLLAVAGLVGAMAVIGAITRLTESGLSMVEWRPLVGTIPPLTEAEWRRIFDLYRQIPEYQQINAGMSLAEFKTIFWWEYIHRVFGRLIGVAYAVPLAIFWLKGWVKGPLRGRLLLLLVLGGLQGVIGWWMVASGLVERTDVSHYRLAVHLSMAFVIAGLLVWTALDVLAKRPRPAHPDIRRFGHGVVAWLGFVIVFGAFVAGTNAGMIHTDWPLMGGQIVPEDMWALQPWWLNPVENMATIQFIHRWAAILAVGLILLLWLKVRDEAPGAMLAANVMAVAAVFQALLGIATLMTVVWLPLAAAHQAMALILFVAALWTLWALRGQRALR